MHTHPQRQRRRALARTAPAVCAPCARKPRTPTPARAHARAAPVAYAPCARVPATSGPACP
eukprot:1310569-Pleurochrysis_carterae.AAC.1